MGALGALSLALLGLARGQEPPLPTGAGVQLQARIGLTDEPTGIGPGWLPVEVMLANPGGARSVEVVVELLGGEQVRFTARRSLDLGRAARRREWFFLPVGWGLDAVRFSLRAPDGATLSSSQQSVSVAGSRLKRRDRRILYVRDADAGLDWRRATWLMTYPDRSLFGVRSPEELPDRALAYDGLDLVVLHAADTRALEPAQRDALRTWVRAGGRLLLVPTRNAGWFEQPLLRELLGAQVGSRQVDALPRLEERYGSLVDEASGEARPREPFGLFVVPLPESPPAPGPPDVWAARLSDRLPDGTPLDVLAQRPCGRGRVFVMAFDPTTPRFDGWRARGVLVNDLGRLLFRDAGPVGQVVLKGTRSEDPLLCPALVSALDSRQEPSRLFVIGLVVIYILVVGPLNVSLLRRRERQMLLVLTVPAISLVFCAAVIVSGYWTKGLQTVVWRLTIVSAELGAPVGLEESGLSIRSSASARYQVDVDPSLAATQVFRSEEDVARARQERSDARFERVRLEIWEQATFQGIRLRELGTGISVREEEGGLALHNGTPLALKRVVVATRRGEAFLLEDVLPGETVRGDVARGLTGVSWAPLVTSLILGGEDALRWRLCLETVGRTKLLGGQRLTVFALFDDEPARMAVDGHEVVDVSLSLLVAAGRSDP